MLTQISKFIECRDLLWQWTLRNIRARYQQSLLGWLWAVVQPGAQVVIFTVIFTLFVPVKTGSTSYVLFSFVAMVPWTFFSVSVVEMSNSLVSNMALVTKIYFPREALPIAAVLARLMDFLVAAAFVVVLLLYFKAPFYPLGWAFLPLILMTQILLTVGLGLACAAANVFLRDVQSLLALVVQLWFYATPIIYPLEMVPPKLRGFYQLNPMVGITAAYRDVLLNGRLPEPDFFLSVVMSLLSFLGGYWFFKRVEFQFSDIV